MDQNRITQCNVLYLEYKVISPNLDGHSILNLYVSINVFYNIDFSHYVSKPGAPVSTQRKLNCCTVTRPFSETNRFLVRRLTVV